jgi:hypothetical protein
MELIRQPELQDRPVSDFQADQLMYLYVLGQLEPERINSLESWVAKNPALKKQLSHIERGLEYCQVLASVPVSFEKIQALQKRQSSFDFLIEKTNLKKWPRSLQIGVESLAIVGMIFVFALMVPWNALYEFAKRRPASITLTEARHQKSSAPIESAPAESTAVAVIEPTAESEPIVETRQPAEAAKPEVTAPVAVSADIATSGFIYRGS